MIDVRCVVRAAPWPCALLVVILASCGGGGGEDSQSSGAGDRAGGGGEATVEEEPATMAADTAEREQEPDGDGARCVAVSHCHSFANQSCARVSADGTIEDEAVSGGRVLEACPGARGIADSVTECFEYIEISEGCRSTPELRAPEWPCARTDSGTCDVAM
ncbi:MAG: hypothetical protein AB7S26_31360 [Sandaracinaceae bacterium]